VQSSNAVYKYGLWVALASVPIAVPSLALALSYLRIADPGEYEEFLKEFSRFIREAYELERIGRELASKPEDVVDEEVEWLKRLHELYKELCKLFEGALERHEDRPLPTDVVDALSVALKVARHFERALDYLLYDINRVRYTAGRGSMLRDVLSTAHIISIASAVKELDNTIFDQFGRSCVWIVEKLKPVHTSTIADVINDVTACHHMFTDWLTLNFDPELRKVADKVYEKGGRRELVDMCIEWARMLSAMIKADVATYSDYGATRCIVIGNKAYVRVGSAPGHATHVTVIGDRLHIEYYDRDEDVHQALSEVASRLGAKVLRHKPSEVTVIEVPLDKVKTVAVWLLALPTSMDIRIGYGGSYWASRVFTRGEFMEVYEKCNKNNVCTEVELVMKAISENRLAKYI
jgi:hypothetical protein